MVTKEQPKRKLCRWAYCTRAEWEERHAVGYVIATNKKDAVRTARKAAPYARRVFVWRDNFLECAPTAKIRIWEA